MEEQKKRARKAAFVTGGIFVAGLVFVYGARHWGWWLPCAFNRITGLQCPGCGISRMCLALLRLDLESAFRWNFAIMILLPALLYLFGYLLYRYIRFGDFQMKKWNTMLCWGMVMMLIVFGIWRNF